MKVLVTGGTGFIGQQLGKRLTELGHDIVLLSRRSRPNLALPFPANVVNESEIALLEKVDAVVHLAGETIAQKWTAEAKTKIENSRTLGAERLIKALTQLKSKPKAYVAASAIGFYGDCGEEELDEKSKKGIGFLADVCERAEAVSQGAQRRLDTRVVIFRIGMVLGMGGGALKKMEPPFRWRVGGPMGDGKQWVSWIHIEDLVGMIVWALENSQAQGIYNAVSPHPVRNSEFAKELGDAMGVPAKLPTPKFVLRLMFGEMAEVILASVKVLPRRISETNFHFNYSTISEALDQIFGKE